MLLLIVFNACENPELQQGFQQIDEVIPELEIELRYATENNFTGRIIEGYHNPKLVLTKKALYALKKAQNDFNTIGFKLKLLDGYRPQKAVNFFTSWIENKYDTLNKMEFYPNLSKQALIDSGYIAKKSGHSRGSTVDVTLVYLYGDKKELEIDMGGKWDYFGKLSWINFDEITDQQKENRLLLKRIMNQNGFKSYSKEWWHFTLENEPYPTTYFDF